MYAVTGITRFYRSFEVDLIKFIYRGTMTTKHTFLSLRARGTRTGLVHFLTIGLLGLSMAFGQSSTTFKKQLKHDEDKAEFNELYRISDNIALLAYSGYKGFGYVRTSPLLATDP